MSGEQFEAQAACGCCAGVGSQSPTQLYNRPGLSAIAYRIGTHSEVLASLQSQLSSRAHPALANLRTRDSDDFSIALLDAYACMADVLTFYQERLANEAYLRTASERLSLNELARLIGYRLKPGVAATSYLAFTLQEPPQQAPSNEPKQATGVPTTITLDTGIKVQSIPGPDEKPQTFETVERIEARPEWNALVPRMSKRVHPDSTATECYLQGVDLNLRSGDGLLFIGDEVIANGSTTQWVFRLISKVDIDADNKRTRAAWHTPLGAAAPLLAPKVYVFRRKASVFGHNAPMWDTMPATFKRRYPKPPDYISGWPGYTISEAASAIDLDSAYPEVLPTSFMVLAAGSHVGLFTVSTVAEVSRAAFAMSAKVTRATLQANSGSYAIFQNKVRETAVYTAPVQLSFADAPVTTVVEHDSVDIATATTGLPLGRILIVTGNHPSSGAAQVEIAILKSVVTEDTVSRLTFDGNLQNRYQRSTVVIYANVALATHGETVHETLGSGAARLAHQHYTLKHTPLTYVGSSNESGAEAALEVRVNDIRWHETPSLYNADANDRSYVLRVDENGAASIQFGDGRHGARLPTGQENVRAVYRKGIGAAGNLKAGQLAQLLTRPLGLKAVSNPLSAEGGVDADSADHARRNMPLGVRTLGRVVSVQDYADYARAYTGIAKAQATVLNTRAGRTVFVTVAGENGLKPSETTLNKLLNALKQNGDPLVHCEIKAYNEATFRVGLRVKPAPDYAGKTVLASVEAALRNAFSFAARDFGQTVSRSEIIAVAQSVEGVLGVDLDSFYRGATATLENRLTPASATVDALGYGYAAELLLLHTDTLDLLEDMP